jgi:hypothetical protein
MNPDNVLVKTTNVVVTSDSVVLDCAASWLNLAALALAAEPSYWLLNLSGAYKAEDS